MICPPFAPPLCPLTLPKGMEFYKNRLSFPSSSGGVASLYNEDNVGLDDVGTLGRGGQGVTWTNWLWTLAKFLSLLSPNLHLNNKEIRPVFLEGPFHFGLRKKPTPMTTHTHSLPITLLAITLQPK